MDPVEWRKELERVAPRLKVRGGGGTKEWRAHLDQAQKHEATMASMFPSARTSLQKIGSDVTSVVERMEAKEKYINTQFAQMVRRAAIPPSRLLVVPMSSTSDAREVHIDELTY